MKTNIRKRLLKWCPQPRIPATSNFVRFHSAIPAFAKFPEIIMLFVLGLSIIAVSFSLLTTTGTITKYRNIEGFMIPYQATIQPFFEIGVFMGAVGSIIIVVAFIAARVTKRPATPLDKSKRSIVGFAISLGPGIISFLFGLWYWTDALAIPRGGWWSLRLGPFAPPWFAGANLGSLGAIASVSAIVVLIGAILICAPGKETVGSILVIAFSFIGAITLGVSILFNVVCIVGGTLGLSKTSMKNVLMRVRTLSVNAKQLGAILLLFTLAVVPLFLSVQRVDVHRRWASQVFVAGSAFSHFAVAAQLLNGTSFARISGAYDFEADQVAQEWFFKEIWDAGDSLSTLERLDSGHRDQLLKIEVMTRDLYKGAYVLSLNVAGRNALADSLRNIGLKVSAAYSNFAESWGTDIYAGPLFSYAGPSPPDEALLLQAVDLANGIPANPFEK